MHKKLKSALSFIVMFALIFSLIPLNTSISSADSVLPHGLRILEVEPWDYNAAGNSGFYFSTSVLKDSTLQITQMSMPTFISKTEELNGNYDIILFGKNVFKYGSGINKISNNNSLYATNQNIKFNTDITQRKIAQLQAFATSVQGNGQLIVADSSLNTDSMLYTALTGLSTKVKWNTLSQMTNEKLAEYYAAALKRPELVNVTAPANYGVNQDGNAGTYVTGHQLSLSFRINNPNMTNMVANTSNAKLYLDYNGDGVFSTDVSGGEYIAAKTLSHLVPNKDSGELYMITCDIDEKYTGILPWKLEITDESTGTKVSKIGYPAFKGQQLGIKVLQIIPSGNLLNMATNAQFKAMLSKSGEYNISVNVVTIADMNANYPNDVTDVNTKAKIPSRLNGNYDMVIFGFSDSYSNNDLLASKTDLIKEINDFITASKQSVMFTHDTAGPQNGPEDKNGMTYNDAPVITKNFKTLMGFSNVKTYAGQTGWVTSSFHVNQAKMMNTGIITQFPYVLPDVLSIATTHEQYWKLDLQENNVIPWYTLYVDKSSTYPDQYKLKNVPEDYYYTFSKGNVTFSGTGHTTPSGVAEQKLFINTILRASLAANHAPEVKASGYSNQIPVTATSLPFNYTVSDPDGYTDTNFNVTISVDKDNDGIFETPCSSQHLSNINGLAQSAELTSAQLPKAATTFKVKVEAVDARGAKGMVVFSVNAVDAPTFTVVATANKPGGYLVGDTASIAYTVDAKGSTTATGVTFKNVELNAEADLSGINPVYSDGWEDGDGAVAIKNLSDVLFSPQPSVATQRATLQLELTKATAENAPHIINNTVTYTADPSVYAGSASTALSIPVRVGDITTIVRNKNSQALKNIEIEITKGSENGTIIASGTTDGAGEFQYSNLPSGTYYVHASAPGSSEYMEGLVQKVDLDYDNNTPDVNFNVSTSFITGTKITDIKGHTEAMTFPGGIVKAKIEFKLNGMADSLSITLANVSPAAGVRIQGLKKDGTTVVGSINVAEGLINTKVLTLPTGLEGGTYVLEMDLAISKEMALGKTEKLVVKEIAYKDHNVTYGSGASPDYATYLDPLTQPALLLNVLKRPTLQ